MNTTLILIHWSIKWWYPNLVKAHIVAEWWMTLVVFWYSSRGFLWCISQIKAIRLHITRSICGQPLFVAQGDFKLDKDGIPKCVKYFKPYLQTNEGRGFILTLLNVSRCLPGTKLPDLSTITNKSNFKISNEMKDFIPIFNSYFNFDRFDDSFTLSNMHNSTKAGPVGMSTQTSVIQSYEALKYLGPDLERITNSTILKPLLKWSNLALRHRNTISALFFGNKTHPSFLRKLSVVNDPEGKARIICIFDYWSQLALKEVHNWAFSQLKKIPSDRTFDQNPFSISSSNNIFYSVDLSAATDRFPVELQKLWFASLSSEAVANSWKSILVDHEVYVPWENRTIKYSVGQPMGAYSSWAIFALTHHFIVQFAAYNCGHIGRFNNYMLLGDDIVIADEAIAKEYISILSQLDVGISEYKTHISDSVYEFAKRWVKSGVEFSGIPLKGLVPNWRKYHLIFPMINTFIRNIPTRVYVTVPDLLFDLYVRLGLPKRHAYNIKLRITEFSAVYSYLENGDSTKILEIIKSQDNIDLPFPHPNTLDANLYIEGLFERILTTRLITLSEDLGAFRIRMMKRFEQIVSVGFISQKDLYDEIYSSMPYHPLWQSLASAQWHIADVRKKLSNRDWRLILNVLTFSDPRKINNSRSHVQISGATAKLARDLFKVAKMQRNKDVWFLAQFD
jgi:hypothetical protein